MDFTISLSPSGKFKIKNADKVFDLSGEEQAGLESAVEELSTLIKKSQCFADLKGQLVAWKKRYNTNCAVKNFQARSNFIAKYVQYFNETLPDSSTATLGVKAFVIGFLSDAEWRRIKGWEQIRPGVFWSWAEHSLVDVRSPPEQWLKKLRLATLRDEFLDQDKVVQLDEEIRDELRKGHSEDQGAELRSESPERDESSALQTPASRPSSTLIASNRAVSHQPESQGRKKRQRLYVDEQGELEAGLGSMTRDLPASRWEVTGRMISHHPMPSDRTARAHTLQSSRINSPAAVADSHPSPPHRPLSPRAISARPSPFANQPSGPHAIEVEQGYNEHWNWSRGERAESGVSARPWQPFHAVRSQGAASPAPYPPPRGTANQQPMNHAMLSAFLTAQASQTGALTSATQQQPNVIRNHPANSSAVAGIPHPSAQSHNVEEAMYSMSANEQRVCVSDGGQWAGGYTVTSDGGAAQGVESADARQPSESREMYNVRYLADLEGRFQ